MYPTLQKTYTATVTNNANDNTPVELDFSQAAILAELTAINRFVQSGNRVLAKLFFTQENRMEYHERKLFENIFTDI